MTANPNYTVSMLGGSNPTQAEGHTAEGRPFYFRARHGIWRLTLGEVGGLLGDVYGEDEFVMQWSGVIMTGGFMTEASVVDILDLRLSAVVIL